MNTRKFCKMTILVFGLISTTLFADLEVVHGDLKISIHPVLSEDGTSLTLKYTITGHDGKVIEKIVTLGSEKVPLMPGSGKKDLYSARIIPGSERATEATFSTERAKKHVAQRMSEGMEANYFKSSTGGSASSIEPIVDFSEHLENTFSDSAEIKKRSIYFSFTTDKKLADWFLGDLVSRKIPRMYEEAWGTTYLARIDAKDMLFYKTTVDGPIIVNHESAKYAVVDLTGARRDFANYEEFEHAFIGKAPSETFRGVSLKKVTRDFHGGYNGYNVVGEKDFTLYRKSMGGCFAGSIVDAVTRLCSCSFVP